jgi:broad specificity phosphatase PhoE
MAAATPPRLWLIRHGETEWSASGRHTGRSDIALTPRGEREGERLRRRLSGQAFALVLTSPLRRARETCRLAGFSDRAETEDDLLEWDYGPFEGRTTAEIRTGRPGWTIWQSDVPGGESVDAVGARADRVIVRALAAQGDAALFAHAHLLRILAARWLGLPALSGRSFALRPASLSVLGHERETRVIESWNDVSHLAGDE